MNAFGLGYLRQGRDFQSQTTVSVDRCSEGSVEGAEILAFVQVPHNCLCKYVLEWSSFEDLSRLRLALLIVAQHTV